MKKQDTEESTTQAAENAPPAAAAAGTESPAAAKDSLESNSPKESEPQTPQMDTPPQGEEGAGGGKLWIHVNPSCTRLYSRLKPSYHQSLWLKFIILFPSCACVCIPSNQDVGVELFSLYHWLTYMQPEGCMYLFIPCERRRQEDTFFSVVRYSL